MYLLFEEERKIFAKIYLVWDVSVITVISSYLEFKGYSRSAVPDRHWIELFAVQKLIRRKQISNGVDRLDPNTTRIKIANQNRTQPEKLLHIFEVIGCCFILSFQGLEYSKGFINGIISTIIVLDTFSVTLHEGCRLSSLRHEHDECE